MNTPVNLRWDTSSVRPQDGFAYFVEGICRAFTCLEPELPNSTDPFFVRIIHREVGEAAITDLYSSRYCVKRAPAGIAQSDQHDFFLNFIVTGAVNAAQGRCAESILPGDIFILDNARPFALDLHSSQVFDSRVVRLRRTELLEARQDCLLDFGRRYSRHHLMPLLRMSLMQIVRTGASAVDQEIAFFGQTIDTLVNLMLSDGCADNGSVKSEDAWRSILAEVDNNACDPLFTLEALSENLGVSTRYLQKVFASHGSTFSGYLRDRRLHHAACRLQEVGKETSVENIALASGFRDLSTFYRSFRRKYGVKPGDLR